jgi:hypothetical protein
MTLGALETVVLRRDLPELRAVPAGDALAIRAS